MRWNLLEEVLSVRKGVEARARARAPQGPFSPEVLLIEMMAQTSGILVGAETDWQNDLIFAKIEQAAFEGDLVPQESLQIEAGSTELKPDGGWVTARVTGENGFTAEARLLLMNVGRLAPQTGKSVTFHDSFMKHYQIRKKISHD